MTFLSTPSGWRATFPLPAFYRFHKISIHALRVEGDERNFELIGELWIFLSTPSGWRATVLQINNHISAPISIHALRVEGDVQ